MHRIRPSDVAVFFLVVLLVPATGHSYESADDTGGQSFTYVDDWETVSAPPPPGPYRSINLDPRIPGQGAASSFAMEPPAMPRSNRSPAAMPAPAAGARAEQPPVTRREAVNVRPPVPGPYNRPPQGYPQGVSPYRGPMGYPGHRNMPPPGTYYGRGMQRRQPEVPPPPVYDAMMGR